ncbi:MAG: hypothetical protein ACOC3V_00975 [bacterium]
MTFYDILGEELISEATGNNLLLFDIDDTLLTASGMHIYRKLPSDKEEIKLTPDEYAKEKITPEIKKYYDYRDFKEPEKVKSSIQFGNPIIPNLQVLDKYVENGWKIGLLTARGLEDIIYKAIQKFLKIRNPKGELENVGDKISRDLTFAVNDDIKNYKGATDFEKKKNVVLSLIDKYDRVWLIDDDSKNINAVNDLIKELRNKGQRKKANKLKAIKAKTGE